MADKLYANIKILTLKHSTKILMPMELFIKILFSKHPETVKIVDRVYKDCLHVIYRRELDGNTGDRFFKRFTTDSVWYAPDVGIIKTNHTSPMEEKTTCLLDDYNINGEGMGNKYMPLAEGNWWSYKVEDEKIVVSHLDSMAHYNTEPERATICDTYRQTYCFLFNQFVIHT